MGRIYFAGGKVGMMAPEVPGVLASSLAVGSSVFLRENGELAEYLVVHHGLPDATLYDISCDGMWLLRKYMCNDLRIFDASAETPYNNSAVHTHLNGDFMALYDEAQRAAIRQVKIPYWAGFGTSTIHSGSSGLSTKVFLLGGYEVGFTTAVDNRFPMDGAKLDYFLAGNDANAKERRGTSLPGSQHVNWWLRSQNVRTYYYTMYVSAGSCADAMGYNTMGVRPALILPSHALFDPTTKEFVGVA